VMEDRWDRQIDDDVAAGRLDRLAEQAMAHYGAGRVKWHTELLDHARAPELAWSRELYVHS
jgi:hypothetical protein